MTESNDRRRFLKQGAVAAAAGLLSASGVAGTQPSANGRAAPADVPQAAPPHEGPVQPENRPVGQRQPPEKFAEYSRYEPSYGGLVGSETYLGKLVPGLRGGGLPPVALSVPDLEKVPWTIVDGRKEFHLHCTPVSREFLPGNWMNVYGYNGSMPGPVIEANQGDIVRIVVHNELPEPTSVHWHGLELPIEEDGVPGLTQDLIPPGKKYVYEFDLHQTGSFFYHSHIPMQEAFGMVGWFIIHPKMAFDPAVDRDFGLIFQNFFIDANQTVADSWKMDWNWHTINGRSGPYTTPLVCKLGERVRIRLLDFSPMQHHPIHLHGHTFWLTGTEGGRIPPEAWIPRNTTLVGVAMAHDFEFVATNPGDWIFHCHMVHHMMNHMVQQVGPRIREGSDVEQYMSDLTSRPEVKYPHTDQGFRVPGYPQKMMSKGFSPEAPKEIDGRREVRGMRKMWHMGVKGLMTVVRVLPDDLYDRVMHSDEAMEPGEIFQEIARRRKAGRGPRSA